MVCHAAIRAHEVDLSWSICRPDVPGGGAAASLQLHDERVAAVPCPLALDALHAPADFEAHVVAPVLPRGE